MRRGTGPIAVIGAGLIGQSWAALFSAYGHDVAVWDPAAIDKDVFTTRVRDMRNRVREIDGKGTALPGTVQISGTLRDAVGDAFWIQENAPENGQLKRELYHRIEDLVPDTTVIASSTSALTWSELASEMATPSRLITAHPFNPPHLMPLVEIYTQEEGIRQEAERFYRELRRVPVFLKRDAVGHIANRLASALYREAVNIIAEDIADVSAVDEALVNGPGLRWAVLGPHMAYHLGGGEGGIANYLATFGASQEKRWQSLGSPRLTPDLCSRIVAGVGEEVDGRTIAQLEKERDDATIRILVARLGDVDGCN